MTQMFFIAGLPRSGSTVLRSLLRQNPDIATSVASPCSAVFAALQVACSRGNPNAERLDDTARRAILRAPFDAVYRDRKVAFDTNRLWPARLHALVELYPHTRIICPVRAPAEVLNSYERVFRENPLDIPTTYGPSPVTVNDRCDFLWSTQGVVGSAYMALRDAWFGPHATRMILLSYDALCADPLSALDLIHDFCGLARYSGYDPNNLEQMPEAEQTDGKAHMPGLHTLRSTVSRAEEPRIIPPDFLGAPFWEGPNPHNVMVLQ